MILTIKLVDKCEHDHRGEFAVLGSNRCEILISKKRNPDVNAFAATLLHELLHLWVTVLQTHGLRESISVEHRFIDDVLPYVLRKLSHHFK